MQTGTIQPLAQPSQRRQPGSDPYTMQSRLMLDIGEKELWEQECAPGGGWASTGALVIGDMPGNLTATGSRMVTADLIHRCADELWALTADPDDLAADAAWYGHAPASGDLIEAVRTAWEDLAGDMSWDDYPSIHDADDWYLQIPGLDDIAACSSVAEIIAHECENAAPHEIDGLGDWIVSWLANIDLDDEQAQDQEFGWSETTGLTKQQLARVAVLIAEARS